MAWNIDTAIGKAEHFTRAYQCAEREHPALREAACLKAMYPAYLTEILDGDLLAGRFETGIAGYRYGYLFGELGYYFYSNKIYDWRKCGKLDEKQEARIRELESFWKGRTTADRYRALDADERPEAIHNALFVDRDGVDWTQADFAACYMPRMCEINLDFDKLLTLGIPGLLAEIKERKAEAAAHGGDALLFEGMESALGVLAEVCLFYAAMAAKKAESAAGNARRELLDMETALRNIRAGRPETLFEAAQLFWLYCILSSVDNYGRMDVYLGDFYVRDLETGRLDEGQALAILQSLWRLIVCHFEGSGRIVIGGMGRRNVAHADRFALLAMEATRTVVEKPVQLSLRFHGGQDPALFDRALDVLGEGCTYPLLYNDDVNVPAVANAFGCPLAEAEQYVMSDCGEYDLANRSISSPNGSINYARLLELAIFDGVEPASNKLMGLKLGRLDQYPDFESLWKAFEAQVQFMLDHVGRRIVKIHAAAEADSPNLFCSMLFDDCLKKGKGLLAGARYVGCVYETHAIVSAADCLTAIRETVFETRQIPAQKLLEMLRANFAGYEPERRLLLDAPKFGNDDAEADRMVLRVYDMVNAATVAMAEKLGFRFSLPTHIGVNANVYLGQRTAATADGRKAGEPLSNSLNPLAGRDRNGMTALLNSMAKFRPDSVGGQVMHLKLGRDMFGKHREQLVSMLKTYFEQGGCYLCIAVMDKGELEKAMEEPEAYGNLMVRVGGFSARFVTLPREMQLEILSRTLY
jgi:pyruvate-formate lyase